MQRRGPCAAVVFVLEKRRSGVPVQTYVCSQPVYSARGVPKREDPWVRNARCVRAQDGRGRAVGFGRRIRLSRVGTTGYGRTSLRETDGSSLAGARSQNSHFARRTAPV